MSLPASMQWDMLPPWALRVPGALSGRDPRARLRHRRRRLRLRGRRRRDALRGHRRDGPRARLDRAGRPGGRRLPARAPRAARRSPEIHAAIDDALVQRLRRPVVRHRHPRHACTWHRAAGVDLRRAPAAAAAARPHGDQGAGVRRHAPVRARRRHTRGELAATWSPTSRPVLHRRRDRGAPAARRAVRPRPAGRPAGREAASEQSRRSCCAGWSALLEHQQGDLRDDATLLLLRWTGE